MDAQDRLSFARKLRDQGLVDLLVAQENLQIRGVLKLSIAGSQPTLNRYHLVVTKSQQAVEKVVKGYFLWYRETVNPFGSHALITSIVDKQIGGDTLRLRTFHADLRGTQKILGDIVWLESSAQKAPTARRTFSDKSLADIGANSEYPFYHHTVGIVCPAEHFTRRDAARAILTARQTLQIISDLTSDYLAAAVVDTFETGLRDFLRDNLQFGQQIDGEFK